MKEAHVNIKIFSNNRVFRFIGNSGIRGHMP